VLLLSTTFCALKSCIPPLQGAPFTKNSRLWGSVSTTAYQKLYNAKIAFRWCVSRCPHPATPIHTFSRPQASAFEEGNNSSGVCRFTFCGAHFFAPASFRSHQIKGGNVGGGNKFESKLLTRLLSLTTLHLLFTQNSICVLPNLSLHHPQRYSSFAKIDQPLAIQSFQQGTAQEQLRAFLPLFRQHC